MSNHNMTDELDYFGLADWSPSDVLSDFSPEELDDMARHADDVWGRLADFDPDMMPGGTDFDATPPF